MKRYDVRLTDDAELDLRMSIGSSAKSRRLPSLPGTTSRAGDVTLFA